MFLTVFILSFFVVFFYAYISNILYKPRYGVLFLCGPLGSGKSCFGSHYLKRFQKKRFSKHYTSFYSNIPTNFSNVVYIANIVDVLTVHPEQIPARSVILLDEASLYFNSRSFQSTKLSLIAYFKLCRHYKHLVILISQTFNDTDKQIRDLSFSVRIIKPLIYSRWAMCVNCKPSFGVNPQSGDLQTVYKIGRIGKILYLPRYYKYFDSYDTKSYKQGGVAPNGRNNIHYAKVQK